MNPSVQVIRKNRKRGSERHKQGGPPSTHDATSRLVLGQAPLRGELFPSAVAGHVCPVGLSRWRGSAETG
jgi:hypothetical protein